MACGNKQTGQLEILQSMQNLEQQGIMCYTSHLACAFLNHNLEFLGTCHLVFSHESYVSLFMQLPFFTVLSSLNFRDQEQFVV